MWMGLSDDIQIVYTVAEVLVALSLMRECSLYKNNKALPCPVGARGHPRSGQWRMEGLTGLA